MIQAGTCITFEFIDQQKNYLGGAISPGIDMRLKALDTFTAKLPLIERKENIDLIGTTTNSSILSGVMNGILEEVEGIITRYQNLYPELMVVLSGGDMNYFDKRLKNTTIKYLILSFRQGYFVNQVPGLLIRFYFLF